MDLDVRDQDGTFSTAVIYAGFDRNNHDKEVEPNCVLEAKWPSYWGDLDFTKDGCLTDSSGEWKQCCFNNPNGLAVTNPYAQLHVLREWIEIEIYILGLSSMLDFIQFSSMASS